MPASTDSASLPPSHWRAKGVSLRGEWEGDNHVDQQSRRHVRAAGIVSVPPRMSWQSSPRETVETLLGPEL